MAYFNRKLYKCLFVQNEEKKQQKIILNIFELVFFPKFLFLLKLQNFP